jgi:hypothetical protein
MTLSRSQACRLLATGCGVLALAACTPERGEPAGTPPSASAPPAPAPQASAPILTPPLGRADLIEGARHAADSLVAGTPYPEDVVGFAGRQFRLRLPFGCAGPSEADAGLGYTLAPEARTLRLTARPQVWTDTPWLAALSAPGAEPPEAVEGFWLRRPWLTGEVCPAQSAPAPGLPPSPETLGLAQVYGPDGSRLLRRGARPYEITRPLPVETSEPVGGFRLVLEGRIAKGAERPIRCRSEGPDQRPICLVLVEFARVSFETPAGEVLETWTN